MESRSSADMEASAGVRIVSRRMVRPSYGALPMPPSEDVQLTPWDLNCVGFPYIQVGIVLPKPPAGAAAEGEVGLVDGLVASLSLALGRYYHFAGRLGVVERGDGTITVPLRCTGEGAELVHAAAPGVAVADVVGTVVCAPPCPALFPLHGVHCGAAALDSSLPVLVAQVTELADGVFIAMSMNHVVGDGTCFWELFNAWSAISRGEEAPFGAWPAPVHQRWFVDTSPVPIPFSLSELQHAVEKKPSTPAPPVSDGSFTFSAAGVKALKAKANEETLGKGEAMGSISSLQAVVAHLWRAVTRARRLLPGEETRCYVVIGCRGRMGIPPGYVGNAGSIGITSGCTAGEILDAGLGWTARQVNRVVGSFDEEGVRGWLHGWAREPALPDVGGIIGSGLFIGFSPRFDVFGNDFGWGKPVGVRNCPGERLDGVVGAFQGPHLQGSMSLDVCLSPETMERLLADQEFMQALAPAE